MLKNKTLTKSLLRSCGVEVKRFAFGLDLREDLKRVFANAHPKVAFDIGANEGQTAHSFHELFPDAQIYSFEPSSAVFEKLKQNTANLPNVTPVQQAMGSKESNLTLKITSSSVNSSLLNYHKPTGIDQVVREETVKVGTVTSFCAEKKIDRIDLLKVDTQGFDLEVLRGAESMLRNHQVRCILVEVNCVQMYQDQAWFHDILTYLAGYGIQLCGLYGINRETDFFIHWADSMYIDPKFSSK